MIQGWCLSPAPIHVQGACGSWIVLPCVPAARPLRVIDDRLRRQDDEPVRHAPAYRGVSAIAAWKTLSAADECVLRSKGTHISAGRVKRHEDLINPYVRVPAQKQR